MENVSPQIAAPHSYGVRDEQLAADSDGREAGHDASPFSQHDGISHQADGDCIDHSTRRIGAEPFPAMTARAYVAVRPSMAPRGISGMDYHHVGNSPCGVVTKIYACIAEKPGALHDGRAVHGI